MVFWRKDANRSRHREIDSDKDGFPLSQGWQEGSGGAVKVAARFFYDFSVSLVDESVDDKHAHLTQYIFRNISRPLSREQYGQTVLSSFLGNDTEGI